jgi:hypothetical protein
MAVADGTITAVKVLYRQSLGGGQDGSGVKKNTKTLVVGEITCTYDQAGILCSGVGGDSAFGLSQVDFVKIEPLTIATAYPTAGKCFLASYDTVNHLIFLVEDIGANDSSAPSDADVCVLRFVAVGDDADAPELT